MTQFDPSRAPVGKSALSITGHAPFKLRHGGAEAWDEQQARTAERVIEQARRYMTNFSDDNILASHLDTPLDVRRHSPTFQGGAGGGLGSYLHQIGGHRPTPELAQYAVPGAGSLYLTGTFMHPPGGVAGGGRATAIEIFKDLGLKFDQVTKGGK